MNKMSEIFLNVRNLLISWGFQTSDIDKNTSIQYILTNDLSEKKKHRALIYFDFMKDEETNFDSEDFRQKAFEIYNGKIDYEQAFLFFLTPLNLYFLYIDSKNMISNAKIAVIRGESQNGLSDADYFNIFSDEIKTHIDGTGLDVKIQLFSELKVPYKKTLLSLLFYSLIATNKKLTLSSRSIILLFGIDSFYHCLIISKLNEKNSTKKEFGEEFNKWRDYYENVYDHKVLTQKLYNFHFFYYVVINTILLLKIRKIFFKDRFKKSDEQLIPYYLRISQEFLVFKDLEFQGWSDITDYMLMVVNSLPKEIYAVNEDLFCLIYQEIISEGTRHDLGEVYTPKHLINLMINSKLKSQKKFLDPSCGSGSFLIGIIDFFFKKKKTLSDIELIQGIDINPLAVFTARSNILIFLINQNKEIIDVEELWKKIDIILDDGLFPSKNCLQKVHDIDLILGNPPWINLSSLYMVHQKQKIKALARDLKILLGVESKNTEICTIFFYQCRKLYSKIHGEIFFVLPASVLNGRQHVYFRYFNNFSDVEVWRFNQDLFKIHTICLYARNFPDSKILSPQMIKKYDKTQLRDLLSIEENIFDIKQSNSDYQFKHVWSGKMFPVYTKFTTKNKEYPMVGRYNSEFEYQKTVGIYPSISDYYKNVNGGIRIVPRRWIVIQERPPFQNVVKIHPDLHQQAKLQWSDPPYKEYLVEKEYLHEFFKSQNLIPFKFVNSNFAFLPMKHKEMLKKCHLEIQEMMPEAKKLYNLLDREFQNRIKPSASMKTFLDNITFNKRLINTAALFDNKKLYLVSHNSIGSIVKSSVIKKPIILDNSLYYYPTENEDEAYFLCGILNSPIITVLVKQIGSTGSRGSLRNIHKNPYNFPIPIYSITPLNLEIVEISHRLEDYVTDFCNNIQKKKIGIRTIQNRLFTDKVYGEMIENLNKLVISLLKSDC